MRANNYRSCIWHVCIIGYNCVSVEASVVLFSLSLGSLLLSQSLVLSNTATLWYIILGKGNGVLIPEVWSRCSNFRIPADTGLNISIPENLILTLSHSKLRIAKKLQWDTNGADKLRSGHVGVCRAEMYIGAFFNHSKLKGMSVH